MSQVDTQTNKLRDEIHENEFTHITLCLHTSSHILSCAYSLSRVDTFLPSTFCRLPSRHRLLEQADQAVADGKQALEWGPTSVLAMHQLAHAHVALAQGEEALPLLDQV